MDYLCLQYIHLVIIVGLNSHLEKAPFNILDGKDLRCPTSHPKASQTCISDKEKP